MKFDDELPFRKTTGRIPGFDYSSAALYFITLCTFRRRKLFGRLAGTNVLHSRAGKTAETILTDLHTYIPIVEVTDYSILPDHVHALIGITSGRSRTISSVVQSYKSAVTRALPAMEQIWQRGFYEHIVRDERDLNNIREYIMTNAIRHYVEQEEYDAYQRFSLERGILKATPDGAGAPPVR